MRCRECEAVLWSYVDRELAPPERRAVETHLQHCERCTEALERVNAFPLNTIELRYAAPPTDFTDRLMRRIEHLPAPRDIALRRQDDASNHQLPMFALAITSAAAAVLIGLFTASLFALLVRDATAPRVRLDLPSIAAIGLADMTKVWSWLSVNTSTLASAFVVLALMVAVLALLWRQLVESESSEDGGF